MFIKFKPAYKKIAMGLLSYMPEKKDVKKLQETMKIYEEDDQWQLYLWKEAEDIIGVMGLYFSNDGKAELKHLCVNPSYRDEGIGKKMVSVMRDRLDRELVGSKETISFLGCCYEKEQQERAAGRVSG